MRIALLVAIGVVACVAVQLATRRYWLGFFLSVVAVMLAWIVTSLAFASATGEALFAPDRWGALVPILGAALIAQCVARALAFKRRIDGGR